VFWKFFFLSLQALEETVDKKITTVDEENRSAQERTKTSERSGLLEHNFDYDDCDDTKEEDASNEDKEIPRVATVDQIDSFKGSPPRLRLWILVVFLITFHTPKLFNAAITLKNQIFEIHFALMVIYILIRTACRLLKMGGKFHFGRGVGKIKGNR